MYKDKGIINFLLRQECYRLAWSLRRFFLSIPKESLVLEVGSGGNPYPRSNVLVDAYKETRERHWAPLVCDRPTVIGFAEELPFKDDTFDFVIAAHVLEHSKDPDRFLSELQRVAKAGYIEVPDAFLERLNPYRDHRLEITERDGKLIIRRKPNWKPDSELVELYEHAAKEVITRDVIPARPQKFHVRYFWEGGIDYKIENPGTSIGWDAPQEDDSARERRLRIRRLLRSVVRYLLSQRRRNREMCIDSMLRCSRCYGELKKQSSGCLACKSCGTEYRAEGMVIDMVNKD